MVRLIAAAEVLKDLEQAGLFEVTRVSGASAGAIAAVLYGCPAGTISKARQRVLSLGNEGLSRMFPRRALWQYLLSVVRGRPLYSVEPLRALLKDIIQPDPPLRTLVPPALVTVAEIDSNNNEPLDEDTTCVDALLDSCALPFVLRSHKSLQEQPRLDGALCEDLPIAKLLAETEEFGGGRRDFVPGRGSARSG